MHRLRATMAAGGVTCALMLSACVATVEPTASPSPEVQVSAPAPSIAIPSPSPVRPPASPPAGAPAPD